MTTKMATAFGVIGAICGVIAFAIDQSVLGLFAGVFALGVSFVLFNLGSKLESETTGAHVSLRNEVDSLSDQLKATQSALETERRNHEHTREMNTVQPVASSAETFTTVSSDDQRLSDAETDLFSEAYFHVALDARIASARRHLRPVAVAILAVTKGNDVSDATPAPPKNVTTSIRQTLRDADTACRMDNGDFALILEDTPENGAVWTVERIRRNLTSQFGSHTLWAGVACYPAHAFSPEELLDQAVTALTSAREWKQDRIEIATSE